MTINKRIVFIRIFLATVSLSLLSSAFLYSAKSVVGISAQDGKKYTIYKIDSLNTYYLIYAMKQGTRYKIVSNKQIVTKGIRIELHGEYNFKLKSIWTEPIMIQGKDVSPSHIPHVTCLGFDYSTRICLERDSINDLHRALNLRGLYLIE